MTTDKLLTLLIITWVAEGRSPGQVRAFCYAAGMSDDDVRTIADEFERRTPKPADVQELRKETGAAYHDIEALLRAYAGDKETTKRALTALPWQKRP